MSLLDLREPPGRGKNSQRGCSAQMCDLRCCICVRLGTLVHDAQISIHLEHQGWSNQWSEVTLLLIEFAWHLSPILEEKNCPWAAIKILPGHPESPATGAWTQRGWPAIGVTMERHGPSYRTPSCWAAGPWNPAKIIWQKSPNNYCRYLAKDFKSHGATIATALPESHEKLPCDISNVFAAWSHGLQGTGSLIWDAGRDPWTKWIHQKIKREANKNWGNMISFVACIMIIHRLFNICSGGSAATYCGLSSGLPGRTRTRTCATSNKKPGRFLA